MPYDAEILVVGCGTSPKDDGFGPKLSKALNTSRIGKPDNVIPLMLGLAVRTSSSHFHMSSGRR